MLPIFPIDVDATCILREARCSHCSRIFYLCQHCDHGQTYCSDECRATGQRRKRQQANRRHQETREGRRDHADRQRAYRARKKVTDQGRPPLEDSGNVCAPEEKPVVLPTTLHPSVMKEIHEPTLLHYPPLTGTNSLAFSMGEPRAAPCGFAPARGSPFSGSSNSTGGAFAVDRGALISCTVCGRTGKFARAGPLRRFRIR